MKYIVLAVLLILQLQTATCSRCTGNNTKDEILDEVHLMLSKMETKLLSQIHAHKGAGSLEQRIEILELEMKNIGCHMDTLKNQDGILDLKIRGLENNAKNNPVCTEGLDGRVKKVEDALANLETTIDDLANVKISQAQRISELNATISAPWVACESSPCENGATCVDVNVDTFICACRDGFFGVTCANTYSDTIFLATIVRVISPVSDPIVFNDVRLNPGCHYDNTSTYTAPLTGTSEFTVQVKGQPDKDFGAFLVSGGQQLAHSKTEGNAGYQSTGFSVLIPATAGQQFWVRPYNYQTMLGAGSGVRGELNCWFGGRLISAE